MPDQISTIRKDYDRAELKEGNHPESPFDLLQIWLNDAIAAKIGDPNAMDLGTVDLDGYPTSRIVLLRGITPEGLKFYTNYNSAKGQQISRLSKASANFFWTSLERQIRVRGHIHKLSELDSDTYFASRPRESQVGAWASPQSQEILDRDHLDQFFKAKEKEFGQNTQIPRPPHWGGYLLSPNKFEFWQGRPSRLHDRLRCEKIGETWQWSRLAP